MQDKLDSWANHGIRAVVGHGRPCLLLARPLTGTTGREAPPTLSALRHVHIGPDSRGVLGLLYILAYRRTEKYFADMGDHEPGTDAFTWRRSQYFWKHKAAIGFGNAVAIARRCQGGVRRCKEV